MSSEKSFVKEKILRYLLKEKLKEESMQAGFGGIDIQRTPVGTNVVLYVQKPGLIIGRQGAIINDLTKQVETLFNIKNAQIEAKLVENKNLNATVQAQSLADALERGWHFRRAGHSTVKRIMNAGARGCQIIISGKLSGQRHRTEKFREGKIKYCGEPRLQWIDEGYAVAKKKLGIIGVKVQIMPPEAHLPDDIEIKRNVPEVADEAENETEENVAISVDEIEGENVVEPADDVKEEKDA